MIERRGNGRAMWKLITLVVVCSRTTLQFAHRSPLSALLPSSHTAHHPLSTLRLPSTTYYSLSTLHLLLTAHYSSIHGTHHFSVPAPLSLPRTVPSFPHCSSVLSLLPVVHTFNFPSISLPFTDQFINILTFYYLYAIINTKFKLL